MTDSDKIKAALSLLLQASPERLDGVLRYLSEPETVASSSGGPGHVVARCASEAAAPMAGVVAELDRVMARRCDEMVRIMERIDRNVGVVARETQDLRAARGRLEAMQGENLFKFVQRIDARAFRVVCAVLVHGDVAKAARALGMSDSTLREFMGTWKKRGGAYLGLLEIVQWRKRKRVTGTVPFNDALLYDRGKEGQREPVLKEVLDGLLSMTEGNWPDVCAELEILLREQLGT